MKKLAAHLRATINKQSHAAGQVVAERLKRKWTDALERMIDDGASYDDLVLYLDARTPTESRPLDLSAPECP